MIKPQKVTMKMVAKEAGVSIQTVSRVVNHHPDVAESTKRRVREVMERFNYMPNVVARSLSSQRSMMIGTVVESMQDVGPRQILAGIFYGCDHHGYCTLIKELKSFQPCDIENALQTLRSRQVDGIIWSISEIGEYATWLRNYCAEKIDIPMVFLTADERSDKNTVCITNYDGAYTATKHLIDQGYQHIAHITGPGNWLVSERRQLGYADALQDAGRPIEENAIVLGDWMPESGVAAFHQLIEQYPQMDAIFAANDHMAISAMQQALKMGFRIPEDLGMVGFDDIHDAAHYSPSLTTVHQEFDQLGVAAVNRIIDIVQGKELQEPIVFHPTLIVRESSVHTP